MARGKYYSLEEARETVEAFKKEHGPDWQKELMKHLSRSAINAVCIKNHAEQAADKRRENYRLVRETYGFAGKPRNQCFDDKAAIKKAQQAFIERAGK